MVWQDILIAIINLSFTYSLILQVTYGFRKRRKKIVLLSALITSIGLYAMSFALRSSFLEEIWRQGFEGGSLCNQLCFFQS